MHRDDHMCLTVVYIVEDSVCCFRCRWR